MVSIFSRRIQRRGESFLGPGRLRLVIRPVFAVAGWLASPPGLSSSNWRNARERLFTLKREIDAALKTLEEVRQLCFQLADARRDVAKGEATLAALLAQRPPLEASRSHRQGDVEAAQKEHGRRAADVQQHRQIRPGFFVYLFRTEHWKVWSGTNAPLVDAEADAARLPQTAERALSQATVALNALVANIRKAEGSLTAPRQRAGPPHQNGGFS